MLPPCTNNNSRETKQECLRQIAHMRRARGPEPDCSTLLGEAARSLGVRPAAPALSNLSGPALYLDFFGHTLDYAVFPHESKHTLALDSDINSKPEAWEWICAQVTAGTLHPQWSHRFEVDQLGIPLADLFRKIGDCQLLFCVGPEVASPFIFSLKFHFWPPHRAAWSGPRFGGSGVERVF